MSSWDKIVKLLEDYYQTFLNGVVSTLILAIVGTGVGLLIGVIVDLGRNIKIKETDRLIIKIFKTSY